MGASPPSRPARSRPPHSIRRACRTFGIHRCRVAPTRSAAPHAAPRWPAMSSLS